MEFLVVGFTGQVKKIWQRHIFFIFDGGKRMDPGFGSENFRLGGGGLVQRSNQGQIDCTCLRFRDFSGNCRHAHILYTRM